MNFYSAYFTLNTNAILDLVISNLLGEMLELFFKLGNQHGELLSLARTLERLKYLFLVGCNRWQNFLHSSLDKNTTNTAEAAARRVDVLQSGLNQPMNSVKWCGVNPITSARSAPFEAH